MLYNVSQLLEDSTGSSSKHFMISERVHLDGPIVDVIDGEVNLLRTNQGIIAKAQVLIESPLVCSRCVRICDTQIGLDIEEEFFRVSDVSNKLNDDMLWEQEGTLIEDDNILDLSEVIRQYIIVNLPVKPLCKDQCKGLCQLCGVNLNELNCSCLDDSIDPKWASLLKFSENTI
jgi:uncharacterized protein